MLGDKKNDQDERNRLRAEVKAFLDTNMSAQAYAEKKGLYTMDLGFARTDALGLIGNRVFGPLDQENLTVANAPVNFPQLWDTAWFDWVQYNASIRMPLVRNIGEALGVGGVVKLDVKKSDRFPSSVNVENLHHMESQLGGDKPYAGLWSPKWSNTGLPPIDTQKRSRGETLYRKYCQSCHLPPPKELEAEVNSKDSQNWHDERGEGGKEDQKIRVLTVKVSDLQVIGTDPNQALNFYRRLARVGGNTVPAAKGLYNVTGFIRNKFFDSKGLLSNVDGPKEKERLEYDRYRPFDDPKIDEGDFDLDQEAIISGVIVPRLGYKARPLNGIWATAPFLHNGSVPSLYQLLLPVDARDKKFYLGSKLFDPTLVGYNTDRLPGGFELDTQISGNTNVGHEFRNLELDEMELAVKGMPTPPNNLRSGDERWANLIGLSVLDWKASSPEQQWAKQRDLTWKVVEEREDREIPKGADRSLAVRSGTMGPCRVPQVALKVTFPNAQRGGKRPMVWAIRRMDLPSRRALRMAPLSSTVRRLAKVNTPVLGAESPSQPAQAGATSPVVHRARAQHPENPPQGRPQGRSGHHLHRCDGLLVPLPAGDHMGPHGADSRPATGQQTS